MNILSHLKRNHSAKYLTWSYDLENDSEAAPKYEVDFTMNWVNGGDNLISFLWGEILILHFDASKRYLKAKSSRFSKNSNQQESFLRNGRHEGKYTKLSYKLH